MDELNCLATMRDTLFRCVPFGAHFLFSGGNMKIKIFERDYSSKREDLDDIVFFGEFARSHSFFDNADEQKIVEFSRFAARAVFLAENLGALLEVYKSESSITFDTSAQKIEFSQKVLPSFDGISKDSNVAVEYSEGKIHLIFGFSIT